jgi:hypothetical protein
MAVSLRLFALSRIDLFGYWSPSTHEQVHRAPQNWRQAGETGRFRRVYLAETSGGLGCAIKMLPRNHGARRRGTERRRTT